MNPEDLQLYYGGRSEEERVFWDDYYVKMDVPDIENLELQEEEVASLHWFTKDEIIDLMKNDLFFKNHFEEFEILLDWIEKNNNH